MEETKIRMAPEEMAVQADEFFVTMMKGGKYKELIGTMDTLGNYTLRNQILILMQRPDAKKVNSMQGWNYKRRHVKPGEKSLKIIAPTFAKQVSINADGSVTENTSDKVTGYEVRYVFEVAQTEGEPIHDILDVEIAADKYELITAALKGTVKDFEFAVSNKLEEGTDAILDTESKTITLREDLPQDKVLKTLVNQISAANVLMRNRQHFRGLNAYDMKNISGVEISSASYAVGKRLGLEMPVVLPDFTNMSDENIAKFAENVGVIRSVSQKLIAAVENAFDKQLHTEKEAAALEEAEMNAACDAKADGHKASNRKSKASKSEVVM